MYIEKDSYPILNTIISDTKKIYDFKEKILKLVKNNNSDTNVFKKYVYQIEEKILKITVNKYKNNKT